MNCNRSFKKNIIYALTQTFLSTIIIFATYKLMIHRVGIETYGIWALTFGILSSIKLFDFSFSAIFLKEIPLMSKRGDRVSIVNLVLNVLMLTSVTVGIASILLYLGSELVLPAFLNGPQINEIKDSVPYILIVSWEAALISILSTALEALQNINQRMKFNIASGLILLTLVILLPVGASLLDLGYCYLIQNTISMTYLLMYLYKKVFRSLDGARIDARACRGAINYGFKVHFSVIGSLAMDPMIRWLIGGTGGIANVTYYDIASRISTQLRAIIVSANQLIMPTISTKSPEETVDFYKLNLSILKKLLPIIYTGGLVAVPVLSVIFFDQFQEIFIVFTALIFISNAINLYTLPSYFINTIKNQNSINSIVLISTLFLTLIMTFFINEINNKFSVLISQCFAISFCSICSIAIFNVKNNIKFTKFQFGMKNIFMLILFYVCIVSIEPVLIVLMPITIVFLVAVVFLNMGSIKYLTKIYKDA